MVKAAMSNDFKEKAEQEIRLPQFDPADFELFVRLAQAVACCDPPLIGVPTITDALVLRIVPIAAYLGVEPMLKLLEEHVQKQATKATILIFEESGLRVEWCNVALSKLFAELTTSSTHRAHDSVGIDELSRRTGTEKKHVRITKEPNPVGAIQNATGFAIGYATVDRYTSVPLKRVVLQAHAQETLSKMSAHTMFSFFKYVTENRAVIA